MNKGMGVRSFSSVKSIYFAQSSESNSYINMTIWTIRKRLIFSLEAMNSKYRIFSQVMN